MKWSLAGARTKPLLELLASVLSETLDIFSSAYPEKAKSPSIFTATLFRRGLGMFISIGWGGGGQKYYPLSARSWELLAET